MVLEATMLCLDNSEHMRNGDYAPSRFEAQTQAAHYLAGAKSQSNPESAVGLLTTAGKKRARVILTPTTEIRKLYQALHGIEIENNADITTSIQVAALALKHRQNRNQRQRIVLFVGSPVNLNSDRMAEIGASLKKNSISIDIIAFGEASSDESQTTLKVLIDTANSSDNCHMVSLNSESEGQSLADAVLTSSIANEGGATSAFAASAMASAAAAGTGPGVGGDMGDIDYRSMGVDPELDPELAMALRVSMEEERARQAAASQRAEADNNDEEGNEADGAEAGATRDKDEMEVDEDKVLKEALELSKQSAGATGQESTVPTAAATDSMDALAGDMDDDDELQLALQLSMQEQAEKAEASSASGAGVAPSATENASAVLQDQSALASILTSLPGVSTEKVLESLGEKKDDTEGKDEEKKDGTGEK